MITRRRFLMGAGAAIIAAPTLSTLETFNFPTLYPFLSSADQPGTGADKVYPVDRTLDQLMQKARGSNPFVAHANTDDDRIYIGAIKLLPAPAALLSILDNLRIGKNFSNRIGYREASQCRVNFERHEGELRRHYNYFTNVKRSPEDSDVAYLVGGNIEPGNVLASAAGATQFRDSVSVGLSGNEPGIVAAAAALLHKDYNPNSQEVARSFAVTNKEPWRHQGQHVGTRYETPVLSFIHEQRPYPNFPQGVLTVFNKQQGNRVAYYGGLYA